MQIKPQHHMSILQRQDRILTGNFEMRILEYQSGHASHETLVQTNGVDIAINYSDFTPLLSPRVLAASNGANVHALAHNLRTPRMEYHMLDAFKNNGPLWRQAFNIAEDWRVECHVVDDSRVAGPMLAALFNHVTTEQKNSPHELFILSAGRLYFADSNLVGDKHVEYIRALRDLAALDAAQTVHDRWYEFNSNGGQMTQATHAAFSNNSDLHDLKGMAWANALIEHAILYHDKLWSMKHLGHPINDVYLAGSQMCKIIDRIMILIGPNLHNASGTGTCYGFDVWQDITFLFDQTGGSPPPPSPSGGDPQSSGDGEPQAGDSGDDDAPSGDDKSDGRGKSFSNDVFDDCRCGTCGR
jgi:hypothetical protein